MKTLLIKLLFIFILLLSISFNNHGFKEYWVVKEERMYVEVKIKDQIKKIELDDYLFGVISGEMPLSFELEALKAQVVASRTFVLSRNMKVDNTTNTQVYLNDEEAKKKWGKQYNEYSKKIKKAIEETKNEVMMYKGKYISALFFASSNGKTNDCGDYFEGDQPYLKSVDSHWDNKINPNNKNRYEISKKQFASLIGESISSLRLERYENGYVKNVYINDKLYSGRKIRELLSLASSSFEIIEDDHQYVFVTYGKGHGVGMSQYGAQAMALEGYSYKDILNHYYYNIDIVSIDL